MFLSCVLYDIMILLCCLLGFRSGLDRCKVDDLAAAQTTPAVLCPFLVSRASLPVAGCHASPLAFGPDSSFLPCLSRSRPMALYYGLTSTGSIVKLGCI